MKIHHPMITSSYMYPYLPIFTHIYPYLPMYLYIYINIYVYKYIYIYLFIYLFTLDLPHGPLRSSSHDRKDSSCALMGPSGSGKSSLLNVLTGRAQLYGQPAKLGKRGGWGRGCQMVRFFGTTWGPKT